MAALAPAHSDVISARKHVPPDASQRDVWVLLTLLDIALGLHYLHGNGILHGDLKVSALPGGGTSRGRAGNIGSRICP